MPCLSQLERSNARVPVVPLSPRCERAKSTVPQTHHYVAGLGPSVATTLRPVISKIAEPSRGESMSIPELDADEVSKGARPWPGAAEPHPDPRTWQNETGRPHPNGACDVDAQRRMPIVLATAGLPSAPCHAPSEHQILFPHPTCEGV